MCLGPCTSDVMLSKLRMCFIYMTHRERNVLYKVIFILCTYHKICEKWKQNIYGIYLYISGFMFNVKLMFLGYEIHQLLSGYKNIRLYTHIIIIYYLLLLYLFLNFTYFITSTFYFILQYLLYYLYFLLLLVRVVYKPYDR